MTHLRFEGLNYFEIPVGTPETSCKACGLPIVWIRTQRGARMPLSLGLSRRINGVLHAEPHFADCPKYRRRKRPNA